MSRRAEEKRNRENILKRVRGGRHYRWQRFDGVTYMDGCSYKGTKGGMSRAVMGLMGAAHNHVKSQRRTQRCLSWQLLWIIFSASKGPR